RSVTPDVVVRENCRLFLEPIAVKVLHRSANASVKFPPSQCEETLVGDVLGDGVLEDEFEFGEETRLVDELQMLQGVQIVLDLGRDFGNAGQQPYAELTPDDGRCLHGALDRLFQPIDAGPNNILDGGRNLDRSLTSPDDLTVPADEQPALQQGYRDLLDEERIPLGLVADHPDQV